MLELITFSEVAESLGIKEDIAKISLALPPISDEVCHFRSFCIAEMLLKRANLSTISKFKAWKVIKIAKKNTTGTVTVFVQFDSYPRLFQLDLTPQMYQGNQDSIVMHIRRLQKALPRSIKIWSQISKNVEIRNNASNM